MFYFTLHDHPVGQQGGKLPYCPAQEVPVCPSSWSRYPSPSPRHLLQPLCGEGQLVDGPIL